MCRLVAYLGEPVFIDTLLVQPRLSLVVQSLAAREAKTQVNADGCGVGWYGELTEPGVYRGILPAWSDSNLNSLCRQIKSSLFMAHVRSATSGEVSVANCHPFTFANHLFMHNGQIGDYDKIRRAVDALIPDALYPLRRGTSDSESLFLSALGHGLQQDAHAAMIAALKGARAAMHKAQISAPLRFAAVHSNGSSIRAWRWASDDKPPSLYWRAESHGTIVASEPFDSSTAWQEIPPSHCMEITAQSRTLLPLDIE